MALASIFGSGGGVWDAQENHLVWVPSVDWRVTAAAHVIEADVPGLRKENMQVQVEEGRTLSIAGERSRDERELEDSWHRAERSRGAFLRRFRLPENVNLDRIAAKVEHGVLTVVVPKLEKYYKSDTF